MNKIISTETTEIPHEIIDRGIVYQDKFKKIVNLIANFKNFSKEYFITEFGERSAILVMKGNKILLTRQYRVLINKLSYEIPGGSIDPNESPKEAALRECFEECGIKCGNAELLLEYDLDLDYTMNHTYIFYSNDILIENNNSIGCEKIWCDFDKVINMINNKVISDCLTIITIFAYKALLKDKS